jgi:low density lipoprotein-related protein 2
MNLDGSGQQLYLSASQKIYDFSLDFVNGHAYFTSGGKYLNRIELGGANETSLVAEVSELHDVAVADDGSIFLTDPTSDSIVKTRFDGSYGTHLSLDTSAFDYARGLVLDPVAAQLYVTSMLDSLDGAIRRIGTDGGNLTDLVIGLENPHDITLDPVAGKLYWTENIESSGTGGSIRSAELDGTLVSDVLTGLSRTIRGIDVDPVSGRIYWTDHGNDEILRADADGSNAAAILAATNPHDVAIDLQTSKLYWTEGISDSSDPTGMIRRSNLDGTGAEDIVTGLPGFIRDLTVVYLPALFVDGFESGDTTGWSSSVP